MTIYVAEQVYGTALWSIVSSPAIQVRHGQLGTRLIVELSPSLDLLP